MTLWKLLVGIGILCLLLAGCLIGLSIHEASTISEYTDPPVGQSLIIPLIGAGIIAIGYGVASRNQA